MNDLILEDTCGCKHIIHNLGEYNENIEQVSSCKTAQCQYEKQQNDYIRENLEGADGENFNSLVESFEGVLNYG